MNIAGIYTGVDYVRSYPYGNLRARLLGFTGSDQQGLAVLQYAYNGVVTSNSSAVLQYTDARGVQLEKIADRWKKGKTGATVQLTIDVEIQQVAERELALAMQKYDAEQALAIIMNPKNGEILALSSFPTYEPDNYQQVKPEIYNRNLPYFMAYEPGLTFEIITLAALEAQLVDLKNEHFYDHGYSVVEEARLKCWKRQGHGEQTFLQVVENSCNPGFIELGKRLGADRFLKYIKRFGFGEKTSKIIAGEATGILFSKEYFGPVEQATTAFGQGISVTPIQQVQAVNGGELFEPTVVKLIREIDSGEILLNQTFEQERQVISASTSQEIRLALESVVVNGSGRQAFRDGLRIGGKTGTAQKVVDGRYQDGNYIVSFIGVAPANNPEVVVYVAVDHPKGNLQICSTIAAPIVGTIIEDIAPIIGIKKDMKQFPRKYLWGDVLTERLESFVGQKAEEVLQQYFPYKVEWHGEGGSIISQIPSANSIIRLDETLHLFLSD